MSELKKQSSLQNQFNRLVSFCKKISAEATIFELKERLRNTVSVYQEFREIQERIESSCGAETINDQYARRAQVEDYYFFCFAALQSAISERELRQAPPNNNNRNRQGNQQSDIKLERIKIPVFAGEYRNWPEFKDLFSSLIHDNESLADVQKFHYLKEKVTGNAFKLIKSLHTTEANYAEAWKRINDRYEHKRFIIDSHLKAFFDLQAIQSEDSSAIKQLIDDSTEIIRALQVLGQPVNQWDAILVHVISSKLDKETHKNWELTLKKDTLPTFEDLEQFLEIRWQSLEMVGSSKLALDETLQQSNSFKQAANKNQDSMRKLNSPNRSTNNYSSKKNNNCIYCNKSGHITGYCPEYVSLSIEHKTNFVKSKNLCFNCLKPGHSLSSCSNMSNCQQCGKRHHTSLHKTFPSNSQNGNDPMKSDSSIVARAVTNSSIVKEEKLLATAIVKIKNSFGQQTRVTEKLAKKLGLIQQVVHQAILGIGEVMAQPSTTKISITIQSNIDPSFNLDLDAYTMKVVTGDLPSVPIQRKNWEHLKGIILADEQYNLTSPVDLLLGVEAFEEIIMDGIIKKQDNSPTAMNSRLGWLLFGITATNLPSYPDIKCHNVSIHQEDLNSTIKKFWELEGITNQRKLSVSEQQAEKMFTENISVNKNGRYEVALPFNPDKASQRLGDSRIAALLCLYRIEKRFQTDQILKERYHSYIQNLIDSEHIEPVPKNRANLPIEERFYLPHHGVTKESSLTTKLRVVFNASRKSTSGVSLNDKLLIGPSIQEDLFSILIRWRKYLIVFIEDIEKMYRQIKITPNHRDFQRLLWRFSPNDPVSEYRITTVIDGTSSATFLATRTLKQAAEDGETKYPQAAEVIKRDFYMDDVSSGEDDIPSTIQLQNDLISLLNQRGFLLKKWFSNRKEIIDNVPLQNRHDPFALVELVDTSVKTLGVFWNPCEDCFQFKVAASKPLIGISKRNVLSEIAKLFDPIGWLSPTTVVAKIFMQSLWNVKDLDWNNKLPKEKFLEWLSYRNQFPELQKIKIPRWIGTTKVSSVQIHGFADASNWAYSSVVYTRTVLSDDRTAKCNSRFMCF